MRAILQWMVNPSRPTFTNILLKVRYSVYLVNVNFWSGTWLMINSFHRSRIERSYRKHYAGPNFILSKRKEWKEDKFSSMVLCKFIRLDQIIYIIYGMSHDLQNAFAPILQPNVCVLLDVGTQPGPTSIYHLWSKFFNRLLCFITTTM